MQNAIAKYSQINGWTLLKLSNDRFSVSILPEYGGWISSVRMEKEEIELLWQNPRGIRAKGDTILCPDPLLGYSARTIGAWPEIFPHGSRPADAYGIKLPMHGEVAQLSWTHKIIKQAGDEASAFMSVDCHLLPLRLERVLTVKADRMTFYLEETAFNYSKVPIDFMWGHHPIFGKPLISGESVIIAPAGRRLAEDFSPSSWPIEGSTNHALCPAEGSGVNHMFYLEKFKAGWAALLNPKLKLGAALAWDTAVFPYMWIWREANNAKGYPYFGNAYGAALEPFSNLPGARERGEKMLHLEPGESLSTKLCLTAFSGIDTVQSVSADGEVK